MKQVETDVLVIAAGAAGLAAAISAAEGGASVIVFEKASTTGGSANMGSGLFAVESRLQRQKQLALTKEEAFKIHMDYTHWRVDARLVKAYYDKSASTIDWLEKLGVEFIGPEAHSRGFNLTWHIVKGPFSGPATGGAAANMMKLLTDRAEELGVKIFLQTPGKRILKQGGRIVGVVAEDSSGGDFTANAKAVIIATGGFGDNPEWIKKYTGYEWGHDFFSRRIPGLVGDGIRMAWEAGAGASEMSMELSKGIPMKNPGESRSVYYTFQQPNLVVNLSGERFINEEIIVNYTFTGNAIARQKNRCAFIIFDDAMKKYYTDIGWDFPPDLLFPVSKANNFEVELKNILDQGSENIFVANSLEELASKTGINLEGLRSTVDEYNKACETGRDELFNKKARYLRPVKQPKFYAGRIFPGAYGSLGGIKINYKTEVLTKDFEVIPGLYAAGTDANNIYGDSYVFVLPGNTMGFAINSGRIAGENASEYVKSIGKYLMTEGK